MKLSSGWELIHTLFHKGKPIKEFNCAEFAIKSVELRFKNQINL